MTKFAKSKLPVHGLFTAKKRSRIVLAGGPSHEEQLNALATNQYWTVLNSYLFSCDATSRDVDLPVRVNAFKHILQVHGSDSDELPDFRPNTGGARGHIFHGHVFDSQGITFVIEWSVIDTDRKLIAITNFDKHENFSFKQAPLTPVEIDAILQNSVNIRVMDNVAEKKKQAEDKYNSLRFA